MVQILMVETWCGVQNEKFFAVLFASIYRICNGECRFGDLVKCSVVVCLMVIIRMQQLKDKCIYSYLIFGICPFR